MLYLYLHKKTHISIHYLYKDNVVNIVLSVLALQLLFHLDSCPWYVWALGILVTVPGLCVILAMIRFYRVPLRKTNMTPKSIVSPADGNIIYIKKVEAGEIPISVKNGISAKLCEFANTELLDYPCWLIGINMTPFDVHKNCAPIEGKIILNKHFDGEFLSLKHQEALLRNERNTIILDSKIGKIGVVQTASRLVRRIVTYKSEGDALVKGEWFGMIKFGSQVDLIIPSTCRVVVGQSQQVYAKKTIIAKW
jgi:phosphatidylserine decarboxylase